MTEPTSEPTVTEHDNGVTVTTEYASDLGQWQITATETETDETLAQWYTDSETHAATLRDNLAGCDLSDLR